jgi:hypothetical protein
MTEVEKAYVAGFWDGEGTIGIRKSRKNTYGLYCAVCNKDKSIMEWIANKLECNLYYYKPKNVYSLCLTTRRAKLFISVILPYLHVKKERALLAVEFQDQKVLLGTFPEKYIQKQYKYYLKMRKLNKRGI